MKDKITNSRNLAAIALLCFASAAFGQTVPFQMTSPNPNNLGGVYTDPYNALVNGTSIEAFCDDFSDEVTSGESWNALTTNLSQFPSTSPPVSSVYYTSGAGANQTQDYIAAAILASEGLQNYITNPTEANDISFALWGVFDTTLLPNNEAGLPAGDLAAAEGLLTGALAAAANYQTGLAYEQATGNNVEIYTATTNGTTPQGPGTGRPQEFITVVSMDEPPSPALLGLNFLGLGFLVFFFRRRMVNAAN
jgi:hypothetical protein